MKLIKTLISILLLFAIYKPANASMDYDGDGKDDISVFYSETGGWYISQSASGGALQFYNWGWNESQPVIGDFDADGKNDLCVYVAKTGEWIMSLSSTNETITQNWGSKDARPVAADYDGDGKTDIAVYERTTGLWSILESASNNVRVINFGWSEAKPIPADYDGDGKADLAVFHRNTATWYILESSTGETKITTFGNRNMRPVPADYDGDGKTDIAVYEKTTGTWYIFRTTDGFRQVTWGFPKALPVPADYDGDGITDIAVFERAMGKWYISQSSNDVSKFENWGWDQIAPLPSFSNGGIAGATILAFGDSITYGMGSSSGGPLTGYPLLLEEIISAETGGSFSIINAGVPGETTDGGLRRIDTWLSAHNPDLTLIMEGTNDEYFQYPYYHTENNLRAMINRARAYGSDAIIATIPPVISNAYHNRSYQHYLIRGFNPRIYGIGTSMGVPVAQIYESITAVPGWEYNLMDQSTANHPNDTGYQIVRKEFAKTIRNAYTDGLFY